MEWVHLSDLSGFLIGQAQDHTAMTGCTAIIAPDGAVCGVDVRGGSPGTRDTDALNPVCNRKAVHAVLLSGGSSFGLDAAGGLMDLLEKKGIGRDVGVTVVPNVCSAILFDLKCGDHRVRPGKDMGQTAGENAFLSLPFQSGNYGAGTGATIGKSNGLIMTNASLSKAQAARLAAQGHNAIARVVRPAHSIYDGDTVFALCSGKVSATQDAVGILAVYAAEEAILDAVKSAGTYGSYISYRERKSKVAVYSCQNNRN